MNKQIEATRRRVTVKDVARAAGVSAGTVSNAISGKRKVDHETRARIDKAIKELGYVPNLAARGMRTGRANTIAIFSSMPTAVAAGSARLGFLMEVAASAAVAALERNVALVLVPPIEHPETALGTIPFDGAIVVEPEVDDPYWKVLRDRGVPVVIIGPPPGAPAPAVRVDHATIATMLIGHLLDCGAREIPLIVGRSQRQSNRVFRETYEARMVAEGLPVRVIEVSEAEGEVGAEAALLAELDAGRSMDGVLAPIDSMAAGAMAALHARGLRVPQDVRVVTRYDGFRARSQTPALTALNLRLDEMAQLATTALLDQLEGMSEPVYLDAPAPELVVRGSTVPRD
ncbi:transcriptional regulator, LacI-family [Citreicella sp. SE45]|nr:transcriptional regulator, LacI-family [Citreicella sp. SE45]